MSDLIDRQAILKHIENLRHAVQTMEDIHRAITVIIGMDLCEEAVRNQPSAESEIISCKDCRHYSCGMCTLRGDYLYSNDYCSYGERRSDDDPSHPFADDVMMGEKMNDLSDRQAEIVAMEKRIKDCNSDHFDYHYCSVRQNHNGKDLPSEFCRYCGACMEVDDERSD